MISSFFAKNAQYRLFMAIAILMAISTAGVYSMGFFQNYGQKSARMFLLSQALFCTASLALIYALARGGATACRRILVATLAISLLACAALPLLPASMVVATKGATRWLRLGPLSLAPLEFLKIGTIWALAFTYSRRIQAPSSAGFLRAFWQETCLLIPSVLVFGLVYLYVYITQNDIGQATLMACVLLAMALAAGIRASTVAIWAVLAICAFAALVYSSTRRLARIQEWWGMAQDFILPLLPPSVGEHLRLAHAAEPYQISHGLNAIANGGFFGQGLGLGAYKLGFLSEVHTDFIIAGLAEETGLFGLLGLYALVFFIAIVLFRIASLIAERRAALFCTGIACCFSFSFLLNAYGTSALLPLKGIAVPFLSYGGSSMLASALGVGALLCFFKTASLQDVTSFSNASSGADGFGEYAQKGGSHLGRVEDAEKEGSALGRGSYSEAEGAGGGYSEVANG